MSAYAHPEGTLTTTTTTTTTSSTAGAPDLKYTTPYTRPQNIFDSLLLQRLPQPPCIIDDDDYDDDYWDNI